jgi:hypothetical protein
MTSKSRRRHTRESGSAVRPVYADDLAAAR